MFDSGALHLGIATMWLSVIVLLQLAAVVSRSFEDGFGAFWYPALSRQASSALVFTLWSSLVVTIINAVFGTPTAWVLVRDNGSHKLGMCATPRDTREA